MHNFWNLADLFQMFCIPVPASIPTQGAENLFVANKNHKEENTLEDKNRDRSQPLRGELTEKSPVRSANILNPQVFSWPYSSASAVERMSPVQ